MYPTRPGRLYLVLVGATLIALLFAQQQQLFKLPGWGRFWVAVPDALHGTWFACVTWLILWFVKRWAKHDNVLPTTVFIGVCIAVGTELGQKLTGGDAEIGDVFFDMVGMSAALLVWAARRSAIPYRVGMTLATILMIGSIWPVVMPFLIDRYRDSIAPQLVRFDSRYAFDLVHSGSDVAVVDSPVEVADRRPRTQSDARGRTVARYLVSKSNLGLGRVFGTRCRRVRRRNHPDADHRFDQASRSSCRSCLPHLPVRPRPMSFALSP